jgi:hypothetical protein
MPRVSRALGTKRPTGDDRVGTTAPGDQSRESTAAVPYVYSACARDRQQQSDNPLPQCIPGDSLERGLYR